MNFIKQKTIVTLLLFLFFATQAQNSPWGQILKPIMPTPDGFKVYDTYRFATTSNIDDMQKKISAAVAALAVKVNSKVIKGTATFLQTDKTKNGYACLLTSAHNIMSVNTIKSKNISLNEIELGYR